MDHRNSTPAIHLKMEDHSLGDSQDSLESQTSLNKRSRHPTWSHSQHQEHKRKLSQFRLRTASVSKSTQTDSGNRFVEDSVDDNTDKIKEENIEETFEYDKEDALGTKRRSEDTQSIHSKNNVHEDDEYDRMNIHGDFTTSL